jgi:hypothetical protein
MIAVTLLAAMFMSTSFTAGRPPKLMLSERVVMVSAKSRFSLASVGINGRP